MKSRVFLTSVVAIFFICGVAVSVQAQTQGSIALSRQADLIVCSLGDTGPMMRTVYVFHTFNPGAMATRFRIVSGSGLNVTYLSETHPFPQTVGNAVAGVAICYGGACLIGDQVVLTITYQIYGTSSSCAKLQVAPHPLAQTVEAINCSGAAVRTFVQDMYALGGCGCPDARVVTGTAQVFDCTPVSVSPTTWGAVKALYAH